MAIDIGADAIDREYDVKQGTFFLTVVEGSNPATEAGKVVKVCVFVKGGNLTIACVGVFHKTDGNILSSRADYGELYDSVLGTVLPAGLSERTWWRYQKGAEMLIDMNVEAGDLIGVRLDKSALAGIALDYDGGWTNDYFRTLAESDYPYTDYVFDNLGKRIISIYGEYETESGEVLAMGRTRGFSLRGAGFRP